MCSNYRAVTRSDRLLTFFGVERGRDEPSVDVWPLGLAPFMRASRPISYEELIRRTGIDFLPGVNVIERSVRRQAAHALLINRLDITFGKAMQAMA